MLGHSGKSRCFSVNTVGTTLAFRQMDGHIRPYYDVARVTAFLWGLPKAAGIISLLVLTTGCVVLTQVSSNSWIPLPKEDNSKYRLKGMTNSDWITLIGLNGMKTAFSGCDVYTICAKDLEDEWLVKEVEGQNCPR